MSKLFPRAILTWVLFIPIAITNGIVRESLYAPYVGDLAAHQISTAVAIIAYIALAYVMLRKRIIAASPRDLWLIGLLWVIMTIAFEFGFGHYVDGTPWSELLADYNLFAGHVWGLFLLGIFVTPHLVRMAGVKRSRINAEDRP
ncbi:MAG TPA: hypothetical protein VNU47_00515 [Candidatus Paceibacterota bacterium]|nr:hypothetical protein [Candidatus Paceibacterota bacterium]